VRNFTRGALVALTMVLAISLHLTIAHAADLGVQPVAGGWTSVSSQDETVVKAARFAVQEQVRQSHSPIKFISIKHARQQVVAGSNISMNLMVMAEGKKRLVIAVVWAKLDGSMELTRWHWV
jgi:hypothetical protein